MKMLREATTKRSHRVSSARNKIRIGLLWHSVSSGNLGVGALTIGNISIARQVAESLGLQPEFVVMGMRDGSIDPILVGEVENFMIDAKSLSRPSGFARMLSGVDCVLDIGAGDSLTEIYGPKRFFYLCATKMMALAMGKPLVLSPQTIGPFCRKRYIWAVRPILRRATAVLARDEESLELVRKIAPESAAELTIDVAFTLPYADRSAERGGSKIRVGVNASGLLFYQAQEGGNRFSLSYDYAKFTRELLQALTALDNVEVHLITHAISRWDTRDDDSRLADQLKREFPGVVRVPDFAGPSEASSYISSLDFLVAGRMHACIAAFVSNTAVLPVTYSRKFSGLCRLLSYEHMLPVKGLNEMQAVDIVVAALHERQELADALRNSHGRIESLLDVYRARLKDVFARTAIVG